MAVSKEVQAAVDKIREMRQRERADAAADALREKQMAELQAKYDAAQAKLDAIPVNRELSQEDKDALQHAFDEVQDAKDAMEETHGELKDAVPANIEQPASGEVNEPAKVEPEPIPDDPNAPRPDPIPGTARGSDVPLMPNMAFDPDPTGSGRAGGNSGQPQQQPAIETAGGFVVSGGGTTQRAPGSSPESPSSSQVVPLDPDAKAPASTADLVKSGLGDSRGNENIGSDLKPAGEGAGIPQEPTEAQQEAAQKQQDLLNEERARREENPLNIAPAGTPQAGSPEAEKAAREAQLEAQRQAQADAFADEGKPNS
jgi:hypothetical protein